MNPIKSPIAADPEKIGEIIDQVYEWRTRLNMHGQFTAEVAALPKIGPEQRAFTEAALRLLQRNKDIVAATGITPEYVIQLMAHRDAAAGVSGACAGQIGRISGGYLLLSGLMEVLNDQVLRTANSLAGDLTLNWARRADIRALWTQANRYAALRGQRSAAGKKAKQKAKQKAQRALKKSGPAGSEET